MKKILPMFVIGLVASIPNAWGGALAKMSECCPQAVDAIKQFVSTGQVEYMYDVGCNFDKCDIMLYKAFEMAKIQSYNSVCDIRYYEDDCDFELSESFSGLDASDRDLLSRAEARCNQNVSSLNELRIFGRNARKIIQTASKEFDINKCKNASCGMSPIELLAEPSVPSVCKKDVREDVEDYVVALKYIDCLQKQGLNCSMVYAPVNHTVRGVWKMKEEVEKYKNYLAAQSGDQEHNGKGIDDEDDEDVDDEGGVYVGVVKSNKNGKSNTTVTVIKMGKDSEVYKSVKTQSLSAESVKAAAKKNPKIYNSGFVYEAKKQGLDKQRSLESLGRACLNYAASDAFVEAGDCIKFMSDVMDAQ